MSTWVLSTYVLVVTKRRYLTGISGAWPDTLFLKLPKTKKAALMSAAPWAWLITGILQFHFCVKFVLLDFCYLVDSFNFKRIA